MSVDQTSGNVFGNERQVAPHGDAENNAHHSIPSLQFHDSMEIAYGSIPHSNAKVDPGTVAADGTAVPVSATFLATVARTPEHVSRGIEGAIADFLAQLLGPARPRRVAKMLEYQPGGDKYRDIPKGAPLTYPKLLAHASGRETWAATVDAGGMSRLGVIEVDAGGRSAVLAVLAAATQHTLSAAAIAVDNPLNGHAGGHVIFVYDTPAPVAAIVAQLRQVATAAGLPSTTEIWPNNQVIRLPFGYHRWAQTRGELLTQNGELVNLDRDLAGGFERVASLPQNSPPPAVATPVATGGVGVATGVATVATRTERRISLGEQAAERFDRQRFNREHPLEQLLVDWGAVAAPGGFSCPCGVAHSHTTTLYISRLGKLFSYSPQCRLYTTKGYDAFGFYVKTQHNDDITAALRELNPISGRPNPAPARSLPEYVLSPEERTRRAAEAQRKKAARKQHAADTLADVRARSAADPTLTPCDRAVLDILILVAGDRGWCRPSKERIAEMSEYSLGSVKRSLMVLEARGYFVSEGDGGGPKATAIRTFLRGSISGEMIHESLRTCDLIPDSGACERGGAGPADLRARISFASYLCGLAAELGEQLDADRLALRALAELEQLEAPLLQRLADGASGEIPQTDSQIENPAEIADGACYIPALDWTAGGRVDLASWRDPLELRSRTAGAVDDQIEPAAPAEPAEPAAPIRRRRPREISAIDRYRVDLAGMEETQLAGELKKHQRTLKKHAGAHWLDQVRAKLDLVQTEIDERELASAAGAEIPHLRPGRRPQAALSAEIQQMPAGAQLLLELGPMSSRASGFAPASVASSPPLTSSPGP